MSAIVAIEGIDGAGKSHLCDLLADRLRRRGLRVNAFDKHAVRFANDFGGRRMAELRSILWPSEAEPAQDPLGTGFYLHLLAAWFHGLARQAETWARDSDVLLTDGSYYRVVAKAHVRSNLELDWLETLFARALRPDRVLLLDIDPIDAWARRASFTATEIGRWDGQIDDARNGFCSYQSKIRGVLRAVATRENWVVLPQTAATTPEETAAAADCALTGLAAGRNAQSGKREAV